MAGHSHSANIRFRKNRVDAKRARLFSKLARNITIAAKLGGGDPTANPRLRLAIDKARVVSMSKETIERAIKKGTGEGGASSFEELVYEGYAPGGVAVMLDILTDNRHRTAPEVRQLFEHRGGTLATAGSVAFMFERMAVFVVDPAANVSEDRLMEIALEAGADDLVADGGTLVVRGAPGQFGAIKETMEGAGIPLVEANVIPVPLTTVEIEDVDVGRRLLALLDSLEEHDDVQNVAANYVLGDRVAAHLAAQS